MHQNAMPAALAAMAAHEQGKFWEYNKVLFANQQKLGKDDLFAHAKQLGLDMNRFEATFTAQKYKDMIEADVKEAETLGANGTPAFFVNGRFLNGAKPFEEFAKVINAELTRLNIPIPPGAAGVGG
jgi:protein-disulfide isomerase